MDLPFLYSVERIYAKPIFVLWDAWTDPAALELWYHPTVMKSVPGTTRSEAKVGGLWACGVAVPEQGFNAYFFGQYLEVEQNRLLKHTMHYTQSDAEFAIKDMTTPAHVVEINFEERPEGTFVKFSQFGELPPGQEKMAQAGMESYFDSLEQYVAPY
jgi:uncharacterized protein YndB with AHSA1/START domain